MMGEWEVPKVVCTEGMEMLRAVQQKVKKEKPGRRVLAEMLKALKQRVKHKIAARALARVVTALRVCCGQRGRRSSRRR